MLIISNTGNYRGLCMTEKHLDICLLKLFKGLP